VHTFGTGVRHELTPTLAIEVALGYAFTTSDAPEKDGHDGVNALLTLTKTFNTGRASLGYVRRFIAGGTSGDVVIEDTISARASISLTGKLTARLDGNVSWFNFQSVTTSTSSDNDDRRFLSIRPGLTYQILRPWGVLVTYIYDYIDYTNSTTTDLSDHRVLLSTQYALREWLVLGLSYRYGARREHGGNITVRGVNEFTGNQVMLTVTARPTLRF
jgi:hypothetical protein